MRRVGVLAAAAALAMVVGGCGGDGDVSGASADVTEYGSVSELAEAANAAIAEQETATFELDDESGENAPGSGEMQFGDDGLDLAMRTVQDGSDVEFRAVGDALYMKASGELSAMAGGKTWIKISRDGDDPISQVMGGLLTALLKEINPTRTFDFIAATGSITSAEPDTVEGDAVMTYAIKIDTKRLIEHAASESGEQSIQVKAMREALNQGITSVDFDVALDADDLPRRFVMVDTTALAQGGGSDVNGKDLPTMTMTYTEWGADVDVAAPPQNEVGTVQMPG